MTQLRAAAQGLDSLGGIIIADIVAVLGAIDPISLVRAKAYALIIGDTDQGRREEGQEDCLSKRTIQQP